MKYLIAFLISFNLYAACGDGTIQEISDCSFEDKAVDVLLLNDPGAQYVLTGTGTFEQRFQSIKYSDEDVKSMYTRWKLYMLQSKLDCSGATGLVLDLCTAFKAMGQ